MRRFRRCEKTTYIFADNHDTLIAVSEGDSGGLDLVGRDVVKLDKDNLLILGEEIEELGDGLSLSYVL